MHDDQASCPFGSRADRFPDSFGRKKLTLGDVVMMHVYLGEIPRKTARWTLPE
jgi:hypothetical protein